MVHMAMGILVFDNLLCMKDYSDVDHKWAYVITRSGRNFLELQDQTRYRPRRAGEEAMSEPKWTKEQLALRLCIGHTTIGWADVDAAYVSDEYIVLDIVDSDGDEIGRFRPWRDGVEEEVERLVDCWNACTGYPNPSKLREVVEAAGESASGRPFPDLLDEAVWVLNNLGGGPLTDCLKIKAQQLRAALAALGGRDAD